MTSGLKRFFAGFVVGSAMLAAAPVQRSQPQVTIAYSSANLIDAERFASR